MRKEYKFIHFEEIPSNQTNVKFKEFYFNNDHCIWIPTHNNNYYRINIDKIDSILIDSETNLVTILGMVGMFFI